ncbi:MAG: tetratricopeptide repeat protein [Kofleriaceae bacterium]|nr:tetratricopeptide repeat protein [Kofleriaceae bacterium]
MRAFLVAATIAIVAPYAHAAVEDDLRDGDKYFEDGDWKKAAAAYDRAIDKAPGQVAAEAYGKRAAIYIILKDLKGGLTFIDRAKSRYPNAPEIQEQEALMLWESDRKEDAIKVAEKVVKAKPSSYTNQNLLGEYYYGRDSVKTASAFEAYLANRPSEFEKNDFSPRIKLGFSYLSNARSVLLDGDDDRAKQIYEKSVEQFEFIRRKLAKKASWVANAENGLCAAYTGLGRWDQAISTCEKVIQDPKRVDAMGSVWYNLATAYLARKQTKKARSASNEFTRMRKNEARGFMLTGDTYFEDRDWGNALDQYLRAEKAIKPNQTSEQVKLSIRLGKTYRRLPAPAGGNNPNLNLAIDKLSSAYNANPTSVELAIELGGAYLAAKQDAKATALTDKLLSGSELAKAPAEQRANLLVINGKALFNQKKLKEARSKFESARELRPSDITIKRALVTTINEQAFSEKDAKDSKVLLEEALKIDPGWAPTLTNIAVLAIERGDCDGAQRQLGRLKDVAGSDAVITARLLARSYMCGVRPDVKKANEAYAAAEREAKKTNSQVALAEIYTEWAPMLWDTDLAGAVDKLELAVQVGAQDPEIAPAAKRNLALALYRRGWKSMREGRSADAVGDFDRATRDASVLKGSEPLAFEFSFAVALLDAGRTADALKSFKALAAKGNQGAYLKGPYAKVGTQFFPAYANYRSASGNARQQACGDLAKLQGDLGARARELVASCWEYVAHEQWRSGQWANAGKSLSSAEASASAEQKRRLTLDRTALALGKDKLNELEALGGNPPESLVNLGIVYDILDRPKDAYDAWMRAKAKGINTRELQKWIDAKKRIYGY